MNEETCAKAPSAFCSLSEAGFSTTDLRRSDHFVDKTNRQMIADGFNFGLLVYFHCNYCLQCHQTVSFLHEMPRFESFTSFQKPVSLIFAWRSWYIAFSFFLNIAVGSSVHMSCWPFVYVMWPVLALQYCKMCLFSNCTIFHFIRAYWTE